MIDATWLELASGVYVRRLAHLWMNVGLIVGDGRCLVIDTGSGMSDGLALGAAVRELTDAPWMVLNTHAHFDHCFGNKAFMPAPIWAHRRMAEALARDGHRQQLEIVADLRELGEDAFADEVASAPIVVPDHLVHGRTVVDVGGRRIHLIHEGYAHTDHDLVVAVPDAGVVFWGDLIEIGAEPQFDEAYPLDWGSTVSRTLDTVEVGLAVAHVPGHGDVVPRPVVEEQCDQLERLAWFFGEGIGCGDRDLDALVRRGLGSGFSEITVRQAAVRALQTR